MKYDQFGRKLNLSLVNFNDGEILDLSAFHVTFKTEAADLETPNNAEIRVYGLSRDTISNIILAGKGLEFGGVLLKAGYINGNFGTIFTGQIKQYKHGKDSPTSMYLDILAADGDVEYNETIINYSLAAGSGATLQAEIDKINSQMLPGTKPAISLINNTDPLYRPAIRGKVAFGMGRLRLRDIAKTIGSSWSIQQGNLTFIGNNVTGDNIVTELTPETGLVGIPEQTNEGIKATCLMNSSLRIGSLVRISIELINSLNYNAKVTNGLPYNVRSGSPVNIAPLSRGGLYFIFVVEHEGDTRGNNWYTNVVGLAIFDDQMLVEDYPEPEPASGSIGIGYEGG